jgi:AraC family transcriptional regulator
MVDSSRSLLPQSIIAAGRLTRRESRPVTITTQALDWPGVLVEAGRNDIAQADDAVTPNHYLALNVDTTPITMEVKEPHGFKKIVVPPQTFWLNPGSAPVTLRTENRNAYVRVALDPLHLGRLIHPAPDDLAPVVLHRQYAVDSPQIAHLVLALRAEADTHTSGGLATVEAVTSALGHLLVHHAGVGTRPSAARAALIHGGLSAAAKRRALEMIDGLLDARLTVAMLAREVGLSPAHFARAFKQTMGRAPHQYLLALRLERARRLLETTRATLSDIAQRAGFADQAHFTRLFKRAFGITPGALVRHLL